MLGEFSADDQFLIAAPEDQEADSDTVLSKALPEHPEFGGPCILPETPRVARPVARALDLGSAPEWVVGPVLDSVRAERLDSFRLRVKRRARNVPARMHGVGGNNIQRPKKAR